MGRRFGVCLVGFVLAGCSTLPPVTEQARLAAFANHQDLVSQLANWSLDGRAAIRTARDGGSVSVRWQQQGEHYRIDLIAPLGGGSVRLTGDVQGVRLLTSRGESAESSSARALLDRYTGYDLPVASLRYWLRGIQAPGPVSSRRLDRKGRLVSLVQQGWRIRYRDYGRFSGLEMPTDLELRREEVEVKLVVRSWKLST